ncbi:hypothetical protein KEM54_006578 [Ascosphaera aggregata]|nr:hypothetical protein KEM54_006578 [Ascosphaera aggregata]
MAPPSDTNNQIDTSVNTSTSTSTSARASTGSDTGTSTSTTALDTANADGNNRSSPDEEKSRQQHPRSTWEHDWTDDNPFTLFRRYADEQISSMLQAVLGIPSTFEPPAAGNWLYFEEQRPTVLSRSRNANGDGGKDDGDSQESKVNNSGERSWYDAVHSKPHREVNRDNARQDPNEDRMRRNSFNDLFEDTRHWLGRPFHVSFFDSPLLDWPLRSSAWIHSHFFPHPHYFDSIISSHGPGWALPYILFSPYSPIHLERHEQGGCKPRGHLESWFGKVDSGDTQVAATTSTPDWRLAFEDLLRIEAGKSMLDVSSKELWKKESGADWIYGMIDRGSLGDQWKLQRKTGRHGEDLVCLSYEDERSKRNWEASSFRRRAGDGANDTTSGGSETTTELDLYDSSVRVSGDVEQPSNYTKKNSRSFADMIEEKAKAIKDSALSRTDKQDTSETYQAHPAKVISTMISTERKIMPDGSIHSKTTRTKRYSDGREEKSEWVETTNPRDDGNDNDKDNGRSGWFW